MALNEKQREEMLSLWEQVHFQNKTEDISISEDIRIHGKEANNMGLIPSFPKITILLLKKN